MPVIMKVMLFIRNTSNKIIKNYFFPIIILFLFSPRLSSQSTKDFYSIIEKQISSMEGCEFVFQIEQITNVNKKLLDKTIYQLKENKNLLNNSDQNYATKKGNLENLINSFQETPQQIKETIEIKAEIITLTKWKINVCYRQNNDKNTQLYVADGTGTVYSEFTDLGTVEVSRDPLKVLSKVLLGLPEIQAEMALSTVKTNDITFYNEKSLKGIQFISSPYLIQIGFNDKLMCNYFSKQTISNHILVRDIRLLDNGNIINNSYFSDGTPNQSQTWKVFEKKPLVDLKELNYKYNFKPKYTVTIVDKNGDKTETSSDQFIGKQFIYQ